MRFTKTNVLWFVVLLLAVANAHAATFFVRPSGPGGAGTSWATAWPDMSSIQWSSVKAGSTICLAGGSYKTDLQPTVSGTSGSPITIKRAIADDAACGSSTAGWSAAYDAQVVTTGRIYIGTNYLTIDGMVANGIQVVMSSTVTDYRGIQTTAGTDHVTLRYLEIAGPNGSSAGAQNGDTTSIYLGSFSGGWLPQTNWTIQYVNMHGPTQNMVIENASNLLIEHCRFADAAATNGPHANVIQTTQSTNVTFRYNEVVNWQVEGIMFLNPGGTSATAASKWYIYGNIWHDGMSTGTPRVLAVQDSMQGPFYVYNNTFANMWIPINGEGGSFASGTIGYNNIYYNMQGGWCGLNVGSASSDYDIVDTTSVNNAGSNCGSEAHQQTITSSPFVKIGSSTIDGYALTKNSSGGYNLGAPYNVDYLGNTRTTWSRGAIEYSSGSATPPVPPATVVIDNVQ